VRAGFAAFRLFELDRDNSAADTAKQMFERAIELEPGSAWAHFGLGLVLSRGPGLRVGKPGGLLQGIVTAQVFAEVFGVDPSSRALRELRSALQIDPDLVPALVEFADLARQERSEGTLHEARNALVAATARRPDQRLWLALSGVEAALGMPSAAQNAAERLLQNDSTDAFGLHAYARALLAQQDKAEAGVRAYLSGLAHGDSAGLQVYFDDLRPILSGTEIDTWRWLPAADKSLWIRRFWEMRAARAGRTVSERVGEHFARKSEAEQRYRRDAQYGAPRWDRWLSRSWPPCPLMTAA
jgi:tetratricopeptide (TPR) repeat protein